MPYHSTFTEPARSSTSFDCRIVGSGGIADTESFHNEWRPEQEYNGSGELREGSNSGSSKLQRFVRSVPRLRVKKKVVGYEFFYTFKKVVIYTPSGKRITKTQKRVGYKPIYLRYVVGDLPSAQQILEAKSQPLFPNRLRFIRQKVEMTPPNLRVDYSFAYGVDNALTGRSICRGPGVHHLVPDWIGGHALRIGTVDSVGAIDIPGSPRESEALYRLYSKVGSSTPSLLTAVGESPELAKTILSIVYEGFRLAKAILRLNANYVLGKAASTLDHKKISDLWLTWVYGIAPTLSDAQSALSAMADSDRLWRVYTAKQKGEPVTNVFDDPKSIDARFWGQWLTEVTDETRWGVILLGRLSFTKYVQTRVLTIEAFGSTAYELIPFSFMLDWFIDIGGYLASSRVFSEQEYVAWRTRCRTYKNYWFGEFGADPYNPGTSLKSVPFRWSREYFACERVQLSELPNMPFPAISRIDNLFDMTTFRRSLNALAIAVTRSGR